MIKCLPNILSGVLVVAVLSAVGCLKYAWQTRDLTSWCASRNIEVSSLHLDCAWADRAPFYTPRGDLYRVVGERNGEAVTLKASGGISDWEVYREIGPDSYALEK